MKHYMVAKIHFISMTLAKVKLLKTKVKLIKRGRNLTSLFSKTCPAVPSSYTVTILYLNDAMDTFLNVCNEIIC